MHAARRTRARCAKTRNTNTQTHKYTNTESATRDVIPYDVKSRDGAIRHAMRHDEI